MKKKFYIDKSNQIGESTNIRQLPNGDVVEEVNVKFPNTESSTLEVNLTKLYSNCGLGIFTGTIEDVDVTKLLLVHPHLDH